MGDNNLNDMKRILFITDGVAPYRTVFLNKLAEKVALTVLYEFQENSTRDKSWSKQKLTNHKAIFLTEKKRRNKTGTRMIHYILSNYKQFDEIIFGCVNSRPQMLAYSFLKFLHKPFSLSLDGEVFFDDTGIKLFAKKVFLQNAHKYYIAGEKSTKSLSHTLSIDEKKCNTYYFSSLTNSEMEANREKGLNTVRRDFILVIGRFLDYKGLDVAVRVAKQMPQEHFKIIGMSDQAEDFRKLCLEWKITNIEAIPFLSKEELEQLYLTCKVFLLPSRRECWGLVINEAASYGTPIVSTNGSGAAVEFLADKYKKLLAKAGDDESLATALQNLEAMSPQCIKEYSHYLMDKASEYTIEKNVQCFMKGITCGKKN